MRTLSNLSNRLLSILITVMLIVSMIPMGIVVNAALEEQDAVDFTITVKDKKNKLLSDINIAYTVYVNDEEYAQNNVKTVDGKAVLTEINEIASSQSTDVKPEVKLSAILSGTGFNTITLNNQNIDVDDNNIDVTMTVKKKVSVTIEVYDKYENPLSDADVTVNGYSTFSVKTQDGKCVCPLYKGENYNITVTKAGYKNKIVSDLSYDKKDTLKIIMTSKQKDNTFVFDKTKKQSIIYGDNSFVNTASSKKRRTGSVKYSVKSGNSVSVNPSSGEITTLKAGKSIINATIPEDDNYLESTVSYNIEVKPAKQNGFAFENPAPEKITYSYELTYSNTASGGEGTGNIVYSISESSVKNIADIDSATGVLNIKKAGTITVTAKKAADEKYDEATASYSLTVKKADQKNFRFKEAYPVDVFITDKQFTNDAIGGNGGGKKTYEIIEGNEFASIDDPSVSTVTLLKVGGPITVKATKKGNSGYNDATATYKFSIVKANQSEMRFETSEPDAITYSPDGTYVNKLIEGKGKGKVKYEIDGDAAEINADTGVLTIIKSGTVTVTATKESDDSYKEKSVSYTLTINKADQTGFEFVDGQNVVKTWSPVENKYTNIAKGGQSEGNISYSISGNMPEMPYGDPCISFDAKSAEVTMNGKGIVKIKAVKDGDDRYNSVEAEYTLTINRAEQDSLNFDPTIPEKVKYNDNNNMIALSVVGGSGDGAVSYELISGYAVALRDNTAYINCSGKVEIKATKAETNHYEAQTASITINIEKADQYIEFENKSVTSLIYGQSLTNAAHEVVNTSVFDGKGHSDSEIKYEVTEGAEIASVDGNGKLTFQNNKVGKVTVKASKAGDSCYNDTDVSYSVDVSFAEIPDSPFALEGNKRNDSGWFTNDVTVIPKEGYLISESNSLLDNEWNESIIIDTEGEHPLTVYLKKDECISAPIVINKDDILIDKSSPNNLSITYSDSVLSTILEVLSMGIAKNENFSFYRSPVTVTVEANDDISHIDHFVYRVGDEEKTISKDNIIFSEEEKKSSAQFTIDPQYRGKVSFTAYDTAGNSADKYDDKVIVVDDIAPGVTISFNNNDAKNGKYYSADRTSTITIDEANFFYEFFGTDEIARHLVITVDKETNYGVKSTKVYKNEDLDVPFTESEKDSGIWEGKINFTEDADYKLTIKCSDFSGNKPDTYSTSFTIDKTKPEISISYDENLNETGYANEKCIATITVNEHNFKASDIKIEDFKFVDIQNNDVELSEEENLVSLITSEKNWNHKGNIHTLVITFNTDARYSFKILYSDLAENEQVEPIDSGLIVDKTDPEALSVTYGTSVIDTILGNLTFGFYDAPVTVTVSADDLTAGIDYFTCSYGVQVGASIINKGHEPFILSGNDIKREGKRATASFAIPQQFRGSVSFTATDKAGNTTAFNDKKVIVVDDIAPGVTVSYDPTNNNSDYEGYFNTDRIATISIKESNFFKEGFEKVTDLNTNELINEHLIISIKKKLDDGTVYEYTVKNSDMTTQFAETSEDVWTATLLFNENADYVFEITYKDFSGNEAGKFTDSFTIDKIKPEISISYDNNDFRNTDHYRNNRKATITVKEHNFNPSDIIFTCTAKDIRNNDVAYGKDYQKLLREANWIQNGNVYMTDIDFNIDARYKIEMNYSDMAGNSEKKTLTDEFCIDKLSPALSNMNISYSSSVADIVLQTITFGFYKSPVTVTISGDDQISGIDFLTYSYSVSSGESSTNKGQNNIFIRSSDIKYSDGGKHSTATFTIPSQFRGNVSFTATDRAGNQSELFRDEKCIVVDDVAPGISVKYDNNSARNNTYYQTSRTATITVNEANFFAEAFDKNVDLNTKKYLNEHLIIKVTSVSDEGVSKTVALKSNDLNMPFKKVSEDTWSAKLLFDKDADYEWSIEYKDFSGNVANKFTDSFTIDNTNPEIEIKHYNNDVRNGQYFNTDREADIIITEHNFRAQDIVVTVKTTQATGTVNDYQKQLTNPANWKTTGNVHTARVRFSTEANYSFDIEYKDMAGRKNNAVKYGQSASPKKFTIDKTAPTNADITVNGTSVIAKNGISFERFYRNAVDVKHNVNCDISGLNNVKYQKVPSVSAYSEKGAWTPYNDKVTVSPDEKFIIYFRTEDNAGNYSIVNSIGIVVDEHTPVGEKFAPEIDIITPEANKNHLYNSDVMVDIIVVDPGYKGSIQDRNGFYSGLNNISYRIYTKDTNSVESGVLFDLASGNTNGGVKDVDNLIKRWSGRIKIDSKKFNSNNVVVEITAEDNSGNKRTTNNDMLKVPISIDITPPQISVSYNNNDGDRSFADAKTEAYFKADRVAKIVITERNFNSNSVNIIINHKDKVNISGWSLNPSSGNGDETTHTATVTYSVDDDYTFDINYTDEADNKNTQVDYNNSLAPQKFTVDKTPPKFSVSYDNNDQQNGNYYKAERTATLRVEEHNFETSRVKIMMTASDNGNVSSIPQIGNWTNVGDVHTTQIIFENDSYYSLDFDYADKAGNKNEDFAIDKFYIDKTQPHVEISKIVDEFAYNDDGKIGYAITATDTNFYVFEPVLMAVIKTDDGFVTKEIKTGNFTPIENGMLYEVDNLDTDGIYRITCSVTDKAGNDYSEITLHHADGASYVEKRSGADTLLTFSVNRNGSTYELDENTMELLKHYYVHNVTNDIVITEINADPLKEYKITVNENVLSNDQFSVDKLEEDGKWYKYIYTINKSVFENEGEYTVVAASKDKATNNAFSDVKGQEIIFVVDRTPPVVTITGLSPDGRYQTDVQKVTLVPADNGGALKSITVSLVDENNKELKQLLNLSDNDFSEALEKGNGQLTIDVPEGLYQNIRIVCDDESYGGDTENYIFDTTIKNVSVTSSAFLIFWANKPLRWGVIGIVAFVIAILVFVIVKASKRKKKTSQ